MKLSDLAKLIGIERVVATNIKELGTKRTDNRLCLVCKKYVPKKKWKKHLDDLHKQIVYKVTLKSVGRTFQSEGKTIEEALGKIKISGGAKAVSVLKVEKGEAVKERILNGIITHHLFGQGSPTTREIHLKKVCMLFGL